VRRADNGVPAGQDEIAVKARIETEIADEAAQPPERSLRGLRDRRLKMTALADYLGLEKSTMTGLVDRAEKRGLLERARGRCSSGTESHAKELDRARDGLAFGDHRGSAGGRGGERDHRHEGPPALM
jgi:hypothetical protein